MNKAFTKETDNDDDDDLPQLPTIAGGKNYITPGGYRALEQELLQLIDDERPKVVEVVHWAASNGDRSEMATTCMARSACARLTGASAF